MDSYPVATNTIPNKTSRACIEVTREELDALLEGGMVRIVPEYDGRVPGTTSYDRAQIMRFLLERPDKAAKELADRSAALGEVPEREPGHRSPGDMRLCGPDGPGS